jgi:metal-responsive CopG/Arc/MetJ family transcriptional regulator
MNSQTRITASVPLTDELLTKLDDRAKQKQYHNNHGKPNQSKVVQAVL